MSSHAAIRRLHQAQVSNASQPHGTYMPPVPSAGSALSGNSGRYSDLPPLPSHPEYSGSYMGSVNPAMNGGRLGSSGGGDHMGSLLEADGGRLPSVRPYSSSNMHVSLPRSHFSASSAGRSSKIGLGMKHSKSLNGSKASLVSARSVKTTIQQEYHDKKVMHTLATPWFGRAKTPFSIAVGFFVFSVCLFITGLTLICLRYIYMNIFLTHDKEELIGPFLMAISFLFFGIGIKFLYDAYQVGNRERNRLKYVAANSSYVNVVTVSARLDEPGQLMASGTATDNAITRTPHGSLSTIYYNHGPQQQQQRQPSYLSQGGQPYRDARYQPQENGGYPSRNAGGYPLPVQPVRGYAPQHIDI